MTHTLNGSKVRSLLTLGKELKRLFYFSDDLSMKSWDVVSDVMQGGYGLLESDQPITIVWKNHKASQRYLESELYDFIKNDFNNPNITVELG